MCKNFCMGTYNKEKGNCYFDFKSKTINQRVNLDNTLLRQPYFGDINNDKIDEIVLLVQNNDFTKISKFKIIFTQRYAFKTKNY